MKMARNIIIKFGNKGISPQTTKSDYTQKEITSDLTFSYHDRKQAY